MTSIINYAIAFWSVVVMNCIQPVNWDYCSNDWDQWLYPEIQRGWEIYSNPSSVYQEERENINKSKKK